MDYRCACIYIRRKDINASFSILVLAYLIRWVQSYSIDSILGQLFRNLFHDIFVITFSLVHCSAVVLVVSM